MCVFLDKISTIRDKDNMLFVLEMLKRQDEYSPEILELIKIVSTKIEYYDGFRIGKNKYKGVSNFISISDYVIPINNINYSFTEGRDGTHTKLVLMNFSTFTGGNKLFFGTIRYISRKLKGKARKHLYTKHV